MPNVWEQRKFGSLLNETREKTTVEDEDTLLSCAINGMYLNSELFSHFRGQSNIGYLKVKKNDLILSAQNLHLGNCNVNLRFEHGIISPAYKVYELVDCNPLFMQAWVKMDKTKDFFLRASTEGASVCRKNIVWEELYKQGLVIPECKEQEKIGEYFSSLDTLITLHQCKHVYIKKYTINSWEQRKFSDIAETRRGLTYKPNNIVNNGVRVLRSSNINEDTFVFGNDDVFVDENAVNIPYVQNGNILITSANGSSRLVGKHAIIRDLSDNSAVHGGFMLVVSSSNPEFLNASMSSRWYSEFVSIYVAGGNGAIGNLNKNDLDIQIILVPSEQEQKAIGSYFNNLDHLITLHQQKQFSTKKVFLYIEKRIIITKEMVLMPELESIIEKKLIEQLAYGDSQWIYREDLKSEEDLWANFKYILEQNNKDRLNGEKLSDTEFEQVKNQLQFSSFYKAGEWLVGENGKVQVHVQRDTERLHLVVMNHEHIAGGSSVYEVINQYGALKTEEDRNLLSRDRRFDVTLMINGLPMIHIELKNKQHSYMDGFWQIKKYIGEGKFTGIFSAVQMFVISNGVNTKYFSAANDTELNPKFISGWLDKDNNPVADLLDFAKCVLCIPEAHEMIARYTVLDEDAKKLILLRPYQIHAIESIREASKTGKSGYVWHTTGSGKTLTSYKVTRNLLMDIPAIDKAIFLIDRKDLDSQTTMAFQAYANNDLIDVDETDNVNDLKKKLRADDRQVIVTTIQKLQRLISKRLKEGTPEYDKIKNLKIAFVVDDERVIIRTKLEKPSKIKGLALI